MKTIYKLTRDLSGDRELIYASMDRALLADKMREDFDKWTVPVTYTIEITNIFDTLIDTLIHEGRADAFRESAKFFDDYADTFPTMTHQRAAFRYAGVKMLALMEEEFDT